MTWVSVCLINTVPVKRLLSWVAINKNDITLLWLHCITMEYLLIHFMYLFTISGLWPVATMIFWKRSLKHLYDVTIHVKIKIFWNKFNEWGSYYVKYQIVMEEYIVNVMCEQFSLLNEAETWFTQASLYSRVE